jgi:hypothetical protein
LIRKKSVQQEVYEGLGVTAVAYCPAFRFMFGSVNAALLFSQLLYWSDKSELEDGWLYKSIDELRLSLGCGEM